MRLAVRGRDPYWGLDGRTVRRDRRLRKLLQVLVAWAIVALLVVIFRPMNVRAAGTGVNLDPPPTSTLGRDIAAGDAPDPRVLVVLSTAAVLAAWRGTAERRGRGAPRN